MAWVRLPARLAGQPEILELIHRWPRSGYEELYGHIAVMCWCAENQTSGVIMRAEFRCLPHGCVPNPVRLVEVGLWEPLVTGSHERGSDSWFLVDWWEWTQPDRRPHIPSALRNEVYDRDGRACLACGRTDRLSLDHVIPWSQGGPDSLANLRTLCVPCNSSRRARTDAEWGGFVGA